MSVPIYQASVYLSSYYLFFSFTHRGAYSCGKFCRCSLTYWVWWTLFFWSSGVGESGTPPSGEQVITMGGENNSRISQSWKVRLTQYSFLGINWNALSHNSRDQESEIKVWQTHTLWSPQENLYLLSAASDVCLHSLTPDCSSLCPGVRLSPLFQAMSFSRASIL